MLSKLVITFLPRSKHLLIYWLQSPSAVILEPKKLKSFTVSTVSGKNWAVNCIVVPQFGVSFSLAALKTFYLCLTMMYGVEKTLESPLDYKEIQPVHPKGDQSWVFIGRTDAEAETPILWPPHGKS